MRQTLALFLSLLLLHALAGQVNHALTPLHIHLFAGGLFVTYAAFMLPLGPGMAVSLFGGAICDAAAPVPFGAHALLFAAAHALLFQLRARVPRDEPRIQLWAALAANLAFYLVLSYVTLARSPVRAQVLPRLASDLFWSEIVLAIVAPWFFALQARALQIARAEPWRTAS